MVRILKSKHKRIKISSRSLAIKFEGCSIPYIVNTCKGRCCSAPSDPKGFIVPLTRQEEGKFIDKYDVDVKDGFLMPVEGFKGCPFLSEQGLCGVHEDKPLICQLAPFTFNQNYTLVIKYRNIALKCCSDKSVALTPAYIAYRWVLVKLFGLEETKRIVKLMDRFVTLSEDLKATNNDIYSDMDRNLFNDIIKLRNVYRK